MKLNKNLSFKLPKKTETPGQEAAGRKPRLKLSKKWIISGAAILAAVGIGAGIFALASKGGSKSVYVYNLDICGMTDYWGDSQSTSGLVRADNIQAVLLSDTQTITGVEVKQGDKVKKGDLLLSYDTTLTELGLEKKRLAVEQLKLELEEEQQRLLEIQSYTPYTYIPDSGGYSGGSGSDGGNEDLTQHPINCADLTALAKQWYATYGYSDFGTATPLISWAESGHTYGYSDFWRLGRFLAIYDYLEKHDAWETKKKALDAYNERIERGEEVSEEKPEDPGDEPVLGENDIFPEYIVILKSTSGNKRLSYNLAWYAMKITLDESSYTYTLLPIDASLYDDYTRPPEEEAPVEEITPDPGPFYTLEEIVKMKEDQKKKILNVEYKIKIAEAEYNIAQKEANDGNIYAEVDGTVVSVLTEEEARANQTPIIKVSGGGGYYVTGSISELERDKLELGSEVTISDWRTGSMCTGTVQSIGDFPSSDRSYGNGNPNASYYPFTVLVDESADLVPGYYVDMEYTLSDSTDKGFYLSNAFVRTEQGVSFVYIQGENGRLERRDVVTGKNVWGSYTQILSGASKDDLFAFPYGKTVKAGAPTQQGDYSTLQEGT